jgi:hypothetical protein
MGGKPDDITVIVAEFSNDLLQINVNKLKIEQVFSWIRLN